MPRSLLLWTVLLGYSPFALAEAPAPRLITTSGDADVKVLPDRIELTLGIETRDKDLHVAKKQNSARLKKTMSVLHEMGIADKQIQTDYISIDPSYEWNRGTTVDYYVVQKTLVVSLKELSRFEALLTGVLQAGVNHVHSIDFKTNELRKHRDRARAMAIQAARDKAVALAKELGQKVGRPHTIREDSGGWWGPRRWWGGRYSAQSQNIQQAAGSGGPSETGGLSLGQITVSANVTVSFELE
jgi:uncharacterized protein YggE